MLNFLQLFQTHAIKPRGVIHVGAHEGQEMATYRRMGFERILWIEANPDVFQRLQARMQGEPGVIVANVAISDRTGTAQFNVTSMDQSSSILPLKEHAEIYPSITVVKTITVQTRTLDELLSDLHLDPADFNFLHLDIQGAELLALNGAQRSLQHIEAINTEVNFKELYAGCGLIGALEEFLGGHGFNRAALRCPYHPTWGDAFYVRRPLVTMSRLGQQPGLAAQMFQYMFLRVVAQRHGAVVQTPPWVGRPIFALNDQDLMRTVPAVHEAEMGDPAQWLDGTLPLDRDVDFAGAFQLHTHHLSPYRDLIRRVFSINPEGQAAFSHTLAKLRAQGKNLVALHVRRGDYGHDQFFRAPAAWYREWITSHQPEFTNPVIYLCSEDASELRSHFAPFKTVCAADLPAVPEELRLLLDFYVLMQADAVAISNHAFSFIAAMLNSRARHFVRPSLDGGKLVGFDPWNAPVLLDRKLAPGEQEQLDALDQLAVAAL